MVALMGDARGQVNGGVRGTILTASCSICGAVVGGEIYSNMGSGGGEGMDRFGALFPLGWRVVQWKEVAMPRDTFSAFVCPAPACQAEAQRRNESVCFSCERPK